MHAPITATVTHENHTYSASLQGETVVINKDDIFATRGRWTGITISDADAPLGDAVYAALEVELARQCYLAEFENLSDAIEFEGQVLSIGTEFLPRDARAVRDGEPATTSYWAWMLQQSNDAYDGAA